MTQPRFRGSSIPMNSSSSRQTGLTKSVVVWLTPMDTRLDRLFREQEQPKWQQQRREHQCLYDSSYQEQQMTQQRL